MDRHVTRQLEQVTRLRLSLRRWGTLAKLWAGTALVLFMLWLGFSGDGWISRAAGTVLAAAALISITVLLPRSRRQSERLTSAREIEQQFPDLQQRLLTLLEQVPDANTGRFNYLQQLLAGEVREHALLHDWTQCLPVRSVLSRRLAVLATSAASLLLAGLMLRGMASPGGPVTPDQPAIADQTGSAPVTVQVEPGNADVERGSSLLILARFAEQLPAGVTLEVRTAAGASPAPAAVNAASQGDSAPASSVPAREEPALTAMKKSLDDPLFATRLPVVNEPFEYRVVHDGTPTETFQIRVYELPRVDRIDARIEFPSWSQMPPTVTEDTWRVSATEGSTVVLQCRLNKEIAQGRLVSGDASFGLSPATPSPASRSAETSTSADQDTTYRLYEARIPVTVSQRLKFELTDADGRKNREGDEFVIHALPNQPPEIVMTFPARDLKVSPIEEVSLEATMRDDFGLKDHGLIMTLGSRDPVTVSLGTSAPGRERHALQHLIELETLGAEPDELVSYWFFADDFAADGSIRRTESDMFFAEVRHFEEIFREEQAPPGGSQSQQSQNQNQGQNQKLDQLLDQQKKIVNATWKLIRQTRTAGSAPLKPESAKSLQDDVTLLRDAQKTAMDQLLKAAAELDDEASHEFAGQAGTAMQQAIEQLEKSLAGIDPAPLSPALDAERRAYEKLLKLRAREHNVMKGQNGGGQGGGSSGASQQQLAELELSNKQNRYESQRQAGQNPAADQQQREQLQVLNRLGELARRQGDMNQKLREMEQAIREARTEAEREELERQLKRLRDENRELLADIDELRNRMDQPQSQEQMEQQRQQLDETRSRVRQASEALEEGRLSQALNAGTRAERELQQMREEMRQKTAGQFDEAVRDLRQQAREISERQDQIAQTLHDKPAQPSGQRSLRTEDKTQAVDQLVQQREQLDQVLDRMKQMVEQSESAEPLLARQLYETIRQSRTDKPVEALELTQELLRRGFKAEASQTEQMAHQGLDRLQQGIERAAESVLGNEVEALKRASQQLADARQAVAKELQEATGQSADGNQPDAGRNPQDGQPSPNAPQAGQQSGESQSPGEAGPTANRPGASAPNSPQPINDGQRGISSSQQSGQPSSRAGSQPGDAQPQAQSGASQQSQGQQPSPGQSSGPGQSSAQSQTPGQGGQNPGSSPSGMPGGQSSSPQGSQDGMPQGDMPPSGGQSPGGQQPGSGEGASGQSSDQPRERQGLRSGSEQRGTPQSGSQRSEQGGRNGGAGSPITGPGFQEWSDQLREIEEMLQAPELKAEAARIREAARSMRVEFKRHSKEPEWDLVKTQILQPLDELQSRLKEDIARQEQPDSLVPIDRDPVPEKYSELVRRYYERIGAGR